MKIQKKIKTIKTACLPPTTFPPWNFICYCGKLGNFFLLLQRPACSAPSLPAYMSASLCLGPVWSPVAPRKWGENVPSALNPVVSVSHSSSLIWNSSCSGCCWQPEFWGTFPLPALTAERVLWEPPSPTGEEAGEPLFPTSCARICQILSDFSGYLWVLASWCLLSKSWYVRLLHSSLLQNLNVFLSMEHLWWWRGRITWINQSK